MLVCILCELELIVSGCDLLIDLGLELGEVVTIQSGRKMNM